MHQDIEAPGLRGLSEVRVKKDDLEEIVKKNAAEHRAIFEEALDGWQKAVTAALEEAVADAKAGKGYKIHLGLQKPEDHSKEYNQVLKMLEMSQDEELELNSHEFSCYVMDEWGWQAAFLMSSSSYGSSSASDKFQRMSNQ